MAILSPSSAATDFKYDRQGNLRVRERINPGSYTRIFMRGGAHLDLHSDDPVESESSANIAASRLVSGDRIVYPYSRTVPDAQQAIPYQYTWTNNAGIATVETGTISPTETECEILGFMVGGSNLRSASPTEQSLRYAASDVWALNHVKLLLAKAFPSIQAKLYAKNVGFDLVLTHTSRLAGSNPLRQFLNKMDMFDGLPLAVSRFSYINLCAFLRGVWGADGWLCVERGGTVVRMGLSAKTHDLRTSYLRHLHTWISMHGQLRPCGATSTRVLFTGYDNYRAFHAAIGQIKDKVIPVPPIAMRQRTVLEAYKEGHVTFCLGQILRILRLPPRT